MKRFIDKRNECQKCEMEDDRCNHSPFDRDVLKYVDSMPRYPFLNSINRYSMYLLFREARLGFAPNDQSDYEPKQPKE